MTDERTRLEVALLPILQTMCSLRFGPENSFIIFCSAILSWHQSGN